MCCVLLFCFFKQKTAYEMRISDWSSDVCSSDLPNVKTVGRLGKKRSRSRVVQRTCLICSCLTSSSVRSRSGILLLMFLFCALTFTSMYLYLLRSQCHIPPISPKCADPASQQIGRAHV